MQEVLVTFRATQKPTSFPRRFAGFDVGRWTLDVRCSGLPLGVSLGVLGDLAVDASALCVLCVSAVRSSLCPRITRIHAKGGLE